MNRAIFEAIEPRLLLSQSPIETQFQANLGDFTNDSPHIGISANGDYVVAWSSGTDIEFQLYDGMDRPITLQEKLANASQPLGSPSTQPASFGGDSNFDSKYANQPLQPLNQQNFGVAMDAAGDFVVVWAGAQNIYAQQFNSTGSATGSVITVSDGNSNVNATEPAVAMDANGDFVVTWLSVTYDYGVPVNISGDKVKTVIPSNHYRNVYVNDDYFTSAYYSSNAVYARRFDSNGNSAAPFKVSAEALGELADNGIPSSFTQNFHPAVAMDDAGNFEIAWTSSQYSPQKIAVPPDRSEIVHYDGSYYGYMLTYGRSVEFLNDGPPDVSVSFRRFSPSGSPQGNIQNILTETAGQDAGGLIDVEPQITMDSNGDSAVAGLFVYSSYYDKSTAGSTALSFVRYSATGAATSGAISVNTLSPALASGIPNPTALVRQVSIAIDDQSDLTVVWGQNLSSPGNYPGSSYDYGSQVLKQQFDVYGQPLGNISELNGLTDSTASTPVVAAKGDTTLFAFEDESDIPAIRPFIRAGSMSPHATFGIKTQRSNGAVPANTATSGNNVVVIKQSDFSAIIDDQHIVPFSQQDLHLLQFFTTEHVQVPVKLTNNGGQPIPAGPIYVNLYAVLNDGTSTLHPLTLLGGSVFQNAPSLAVGQSEILPADFTLSPDAAVNFSTGSHYDFTAEISIGSPTNDFAHITIANSTQSYEFVGTPGSASPAKSKAATIAFFTPTNPNYPYTYLKMLDSTLRKVDSNALDGDGDLVSDKEFITLNEEPIFYPYQDTHVPPHATLGIGIDLTQLDANLIHAMASAVKHFTMSTPALKALFLNKDDVGIIEELTTLAKEQGPADKAHPSIRSKDVISDTDSSTLFNLAFPIYEMKALQGVTSNVTTGQRTALVDMIYNAGEIYSGIIPALDSNDIVEAAFSYANHKRSADVKSRMLGDFEMLFSPLLFPNVSPQLGSIVTPLRTQPALPNASPILDQPESSTNSAFITPVQFHHAIPASALASNSAFVHPEIHALDSAAVLAITGQPPASIVAGAAFEITVAVQNAQGGVDTSFTGTVTVSGNGLGGSPTTIQAVNGVATFSNLIIAQAGTHFVLTASSSGLQSVNTAPIIVTAGSASQLLIASPHTSVITNGEFSLETIARDSLGNIDPSFSGPVTLAFGANSAGADLAGELTVNAIKGIAIFTGISIDKLGSSYTLRATSPGLAAGISSPFGVIDELKVSTQPPSSVKAGDTFGLVVEATDAHGNVDTSFAGRVTLAPSSGILSGTLSVTAAAGMATFSGLSFASAKNYVIVASSDRLDDAQTGLIAVQMGPPTQLVVAAGPTTGVLVNGTFGATVDVEDAFGNIDIGFSNRVTLTLASNIGGAHLIGNFTASATAGVATFANLSIDQVGSGYHLVGAAAGLPPILSAAFNVTDQLVITTQPPGNVAAGATFGTVVTAEDAHGVVDNSFNGVVSVQDTLEGSTLAGMVSLHATNGVATFSNLKVTQAGIDSLLATSSVSPSVTSITFTVIGGPAAQLIINGPATSVLLNGPFGLEVDAQDALGNIDSSYNGTVTLSLGSKPGNATLGGALTAQAINGIAEFSTLNINKTGSGYSIVATATALTAATSSTFNVNTDQLTVFTPAPASVAAGTPFGLTVKALNGTGAVDTSYSGSVTLSLADFFGNPASLNGAATVQAINGIAVFADLVQDQAGDFTVSLSADGQAGTYDYLTVTPAAATRLRFTSSPPSAVSKGASFSASVEADDAFGNLDTNFNGPITLSLGANSGVATLGGKITVSAANGVAAFSDLTLNPTGSGYILQAMSGNLLSASSHAFKVAASGVATHLVVTSEPSGDLTAGNSFSVIVQAQDDFGTVDSSFAGAVSVSLPESSSGVSLGGSVNLSASHGSVVFSGLTIDQANSDYTLSVSSDGFSPTPTQSFDIVAGPATQFDVLAPAEAALTNKPFNVVVLAKDAFGNMDASFEGSVSLQLFSNPGNATLSGTLTVSAIDGQADFDALTLNAPGNGYTLKAITNPSIAGVSPSFNVNNDQFIVSTQPPSTIVSGIPFGLTVQVLDGRGNVDLNFMGSVTAELVNLGNGNASLHGISTINVINGIATFDGLTLDEPGSFLFSISSPDSDVSESVSNPFTLAGIANSNIASTLVVTQVPQFAYIGGAFPSPLIVSIEDGQGNVILGDSSSVTLKLLTGPKGAKLNGTLVTHAVNGQATFNGLSLTKAGTYTLQAVDGLLAAGVSDHIIVTLPPAKLVFKQQPRSSIAGHDIAPAMTVWVEDSSGHLATFDNSTISISLVKANGATLSGTTSIQVVNGVATFSDLELTKSGSYNFLVTDGVLKNSKSSGFFITPETSSAHLVLQAIPNQTSTIVGKTFSQRVIVEDQDQYDNVITTEHSNVALKIVSGPIGGALGGTIIAALNKGIAIFNKTTLSLAGSYTLAATDSSLAITTPVQVSETISQATTTIAAIHPAKSYKANKPIALSETFKSTAPSTIPFTNVGVGIFDQNNHLLTNATINSDGTVKLVILGLTAGTYTCTVRYPGDTNHSATTSSAFVLLIQP